MTQTRESRTAHQDHAKAAGIRCSRAKRGERGPCINCGYQVITETRKPVEGECEPRQTAQRGKP
jgi:hypothetical protein